MSQYTIEDILECPSLPSLPAVAAKLIELTGDPDVQISEIAKTVQQDQALAGKVLKTVNSSYYGLPNRCGSIDRAMGYLGLNTVKSLVLGFSLVEATNATESEGFDMIGHWRRTLMGATAARFLAEHFRLSDKDEVFTAALFQDMGMLAIYTAMQEDYTSVAKDISHRKLTSIENEAFGFGHAKVGAALAKKWQLPENISEAIAFHHDPDKSQGSDVDMVRAVALGTQVAEALSTDNPASSIRRIERLTGSWFPKQKIDIEELFESVNESAKELASLFNTEIGDIKDVKTLMNQAQDRGLEHQISMQRQAENLEKQAFTDGLTNIPNRKEFDNLIVQEYDKFKESGTGFAVLFFDADKFKSVNDTHGHAVGDLVLIELSKRATDAVGKEGTVCRYGGEEFGVVLPGHSVVNAGMLAEQVRSKIAEIPFDIRSLDEGPDELPVTVSIGVSSVDAGPTSRLTKPDQMVSEADAGVYAAKEAGRNNVQIWSPDIGAATPPVIEDNTNPDEPVIPDGNGKIERVMIIEDDALAATLLITLLNRKTDVEISWVKDGREAVKAFKQSVADFTRPADLVICDLNLPDMTGFDTFRSFKEAGLHHQLPFYMLTSNDSEQTRAEASRLGISECIGKSDFTKNIGKWINIMVPPNLRAA
ncbi:MAG: HDOD domain-containing protein [Phycisphaerales bacterium]